MTKSSVSVKIYNETYGLKTDAPVEQVMEIAAMVDSRMHKLADEKGVRNVEKAAVWTALDLAAELYELRQRYERVLQAVREQ